MGSAGKRSTGGGDGSGNKEDDWDPAAAADAVTGPFTDRDCRLVFVFSSMTVVDELRRSSKDS